MRPPKKFNCYFAKRERLYEVLMAVLIDKLSYKKNHKSAIFILLIYAMSQFMFSLNKSPLQGQCLLFFV